MMNSVSAQRSAFNTALCEFLDNSPTPFHAAQSLAAMLDRAGFTQLDEAQSWALRDGGRYYVLRNQSSLIAWVQGRASLAESGWRIMGAHTDSPCLKVKPTPDLKKHNYWQLGVEVYGGALLNPWFDRDLSLAGRVHYVTDAGIASKLIDLRCPVAIIPSLAIHLDREANKNRSVNAQQHLPVMMSVLNNATTHSSDTSTDSLRDSVVRYENLHQLLLSQLNSGVAQADEAIAILDYELFFYDTQPANVIGISGDFIASARLDNLLSCYIDVRALVDAADSGQWSLLVCSDHEEVGSQSAAGAAGPFLQQVLARISEAVDAGTSEGFARAISNSMLVSTDNAHAIHPNYADKMDANHAPIINYGPVIKINANQRYASNSETQARFRALCQHLGIDVQNFVVRSDMGCGSTIGPITAAELGIPTLDLGVPTLAMHSIRELAGCADAYNLYRALTAFCLRQ